MSAPFDLSRKFGQLGSPGQLVNSGGPASQGQTVNPGQLANPGQPASPGINPANRPVVERASFDPPTQPQSAIDKNQTNQAGQPDLANQVSLTNQTNHSARFSRWLFPLLSLLLVAIFLGGVWAWKNGGEIGGLNFSKTLSIRNYDQDQENRNNISYEQAQQQAIAQFKPPLGDDPCFVSTKDQFCQPVLEPAPDGYGSNVRQLRMIKGNEPVERYQDLKFLVGAMLSYPSQQFELEPRADAEAIPFALVTNGLRNQINPAFLFVLTENLLNDSALFDPKIDSNKAQQVQVYTAGLASQIRRNLDLFQQKGDLAFQEITNGEIYSKLSWPNKLDVAVLVVTNSLADLSTQIELFSQSAKLGSQYQNIIVQNWGETQQLRPLGIDTHSIDQSRIFEGHLLEFNFLSEPKPIYAQDDVPNHLEVCHQDQSYVCYQSEVEEATQDTLTLNKLSCYPDPRWNFFCSGYLYAID